MNQEDYPSDSDASDDDFRPDKEEADTASELDSDDEDDEGQSTVAQGSTKRKQKPTGSSRKKPRGSGKQIKIVSTSHHSEDEKDEELDDAEEKRRTDALWADFLGGSSSSNSTANRTDVNGSTSASKSVDNKKQAPKSDSDMKPASKPVIAEKKKPTVAKLFEFAGEQIVIAEDSTVKSVSGSDKNPTSNVPIHSKEPAKKGFPMRGNGVGGASGGRLGAVLNHISKKNQLSTLEKTKLDWTSFKRQEGIEEDLHTHNKGKDGYLERRDFLDRTDLRQFEIEKSFRQTKRSNR